MNRREFVRVAVLGGIVALRPARGLAQQPQPPAPGDKLYDPSMVQQRPAVVAADNDTEVKALEHRLKCTCGCNLDIYTCRTTDFTCTYSPGLHAEVLDLRADGKSSDEVIAAFVAKYGEQILMAPKPEGFNLAGYLLPGGAVLTAGALLAAVLLRRGRRGADLVPAPASLKTATSSAEQDRLQRALADVED